MQHACLLRRVLVLATVVAAPFLPTASGGPATPGPLQGRSAAGLQRPGSGVVPASVPNAPGGSGDEVVGCALCEGGTSCPEAGMLGLECSDPDAVTHADIDPCVQATVGDCPDLAPCPCNDEWRISYHNTYGPDEGPWGDPLLDPLDSPVVLPLPRFDPSLGELKQVILEVKLEVTDMLFEIENGSASACLNPLDFWTIFAGVRIWKGDDPYGPGAQLLKELSIDKNGPDPGPLPAYDQNLDWRGTSGRSFVTDSCAYCKLCVEEDTQGCLRLADFLGTDCIDFAAAGNADNDHFAFCDNIFLHFAAKEGVTIQVTYVYCPNMPPVACPDQGAPVCENDCVTIDVLANDCDPDCDEGCACGTPTVHCTDTPGKTIDPTSIQFCIDGDENNTTIGPLTTAHGTATIVNGQIEYCAGPGMYDPRLTTPDEFYYRVADGEGCYSDCVRVDLTILPKPRAMPDQDMTCEGVCVDIPVYQNDQPQGNPDPLANIVPSTVTICADSDGIIILPGDPGSEGLLEGWIRYCPPPGCGSVDTFSYKIQNGYGCWSDCTSVMVEVKCPPTAVPDMGEVCAGQDVTIAVLDNDIPYMDRDLVPGTLERCMDPGDCGGGCGPVGGTVEFENGEAVFHADEAFRGTAFFYYHVADTNGCVSNCARVEVEVYATPIANPDCFQFDEDPIPAELDIDVLANDTIQGQPIPLPNPYTIEICQQPQFGMPIVPADIDQANGIVTYRPTMEFVDTDSFTYRLLNPFVQDCNSECVEVQVKRRLCPPYNRRMAGSLLLYPEFDNRPGSCTILTITNTRSGDQSVKVEFRYIGSDDCLYVGRIATLTPHDTLTVFTKVHSPTQDQGYVYAYAEDLAPNAQPIVYNNLIGQLITIDGVHMFDFGVNAVSFKGVGEHRTLTDVDEDGIRDLNGIEYQEAPDEIYIPRFLGQDAGYQSELILINLSGGIAFTTEVDFLVYNDNEEELSFSHTFYCWERRPLLEISEVFGNDWLRTFTGHDPAEIIGQEDREAGWMKLNGKVASSGFKDILDPAIYAVLVEVRNDAGVYSAAADLPWEICIQDNGSLLPKSVHGDNED